MTKKPKKKLIDKDELKELKGHAQEKNTYVDALQRMKAEFDNYRKRTQKEKEEYKQYLIEDFLLELLPVLDNFERALSSVNEKQKKDPFIKGMIMVQKQFLEILESRGLTRITCIGEQFDPHYHEAIMYEPSNSAPEGIIINEILPGYSFGNKVIRHSKVFVSKRYGINNYIIHELLEKTDYFSYKLQATSFPPEVDPPLEAMLAL